MRKTRRVHIAAELFILAFSVYAAFTLVSLQLQIREKEKKMAVLQAAIDQQELENRQIQDILDNADDTEYIAEIAREKLGYVAPGERVFVDISSK